MRPPRESTALVRNRRMTSTSGVSRLCSVDARQRGLPQVVCLLPPQRSSALLCNPSMCPHFLSLPFFLFPWIMVLELHQNNSSPPLGRWFLRQGWLLAVPPRGEPRPRMFFLFSDVLLMAKPRPPLHLLQNGTFACRALYPMAQCQLQRVFGHSGGSCGGLLSVSKRQEPEVR